MMKDKRDKSRETKEERGERREEKNTDVRNAFTKQAKRVY